MFCQARHRWVTFNKFSFPLGDVAFCSLNDPCKNPCKLLLHRVGSNPLSPGSSTSGPVTFISKGLTPFIMFPPFPIHGTWLRNRSSPESPFFPLIRPKSHSCSKRQAERWPGSATSRLSKPHNLQNNLIF